MVHVPPVPAGRTTPRWSVDGGGQTPAGMPPMATLPAAGISVCVGPPLLARAVSNGLVFGMSPVPAVPQIGPLKRLWPPDTKVAVLLTKQLTGVPFATMLWVIDTCAKSFCSKSPAPDPAVLLAIVSLRKLCPESTPTCLTVTWRTAAPVKQSSVI